MHLIKNVSPLSHVIMVKKKKRERSTRGIVLESEFSLEICAFDEHFRKTGNSTKKQQKFSWKSHRNCVTGIVGLFLGQETKSEAGVSSRLCFLFFPGKMSSGGWFQWAGLAGWYPMRSVNAHSK